MRISDWSSDVCSSDLMPAFARRSFRRWFQDRAAPSAGGERVMLWPDTFNNHFRPDTAIAATRLLESAGYSVAIPDRPLCCGRPLDEWGFLDEAKALWEENCAAQRWEIEQGDTIIGLETAGTSQYTNALPGQV